MVYAFDLLLKNSGRSKAALGKIRGNSLYFPCFLEFFPETGSRGTASSASY
jgi:hypothetical protein